jgi:hypothetical protein
VYLRAQKGVLLGVKSSGPTHSPTLGMHKSACVRRPLLDGIRFWKALLNPGPSLDPLLARGSASFFPPEALSLTHFLLTAVNIVPSGSDARRRSCVQWRIVS